MTNLQIQTGCSKIDAMLKDQNICEFAGLPASGKTQFAHWICLYTLVINPLSKVIFIDSGSNFSPHRLRDFWSHEFFKDFKRSISSKSILQRLLIFKCFEPKDLLQALAQQIPLDCCLIVIDSISDILGPLAGSDHKTINQTGSLIKSVVKKKNIPFLKIINGSVSANSWSYSNVPKGQVETHSKPALGAVWSKFLSTQLYFTPTKDRLQFQTSLLSGSPSFDWDSDVLSYEEGGKIYSVIESLVECSSEGSLKSCHLYIGKFKIFTN